MPNPWDNDPIVSAPQGGGLEAVALPPKMPAQTPTQAALDEANLQLKRKELAETNKGGGKLTAEDRGKFTRQRQGALGLQKRINEVEQLYRDAFRGEGGDTIAPDGTRVAGSPGIGSIKEYLPGNAPIIGRPVNEVFRNAGGALMGDLAAAYGLTAQQQNTPVELKIRFGPFIPEPGDRDEVIEAKIKRLKEIAAEQERQALDALGIAPNPNQAPTVEDVTNEGGDRRSDLSLADLVAGRDKDAPPPEPTLTPSGGETRSVVDPKAQKIAGRIGSLIAQGASFNRIMGAAVGMDPSLRNDPRFRKSVEDAIGQMKRPEVRNYVTKTGSYPFDPSFYTREEPLSAAEGALNAAARSAPGAYAARAGDAITAGNLDRLVGATGGDADSARLALDFAGQDNPFAATAGDVSGGVLAAMLGEAGLAKLGMTPGLGRSLLADSTYGGITNASNAEDGNVLGNLAKGALMAGAGSLTGQKLIRGTGNAMRGVTNPSVQYAVREIPDALTVGQVAGQSGRLGQMVKGVEDRLSGLPVVGDQINARRLEGLTKMNSKAFDRALEPIGEKIDGQFGEEAVAAAQQKVSDAFNRALSGKQAAIDVDFINEAAAAKSSISRLPRVADEVESSIDEVISNYVDPATLTITGENLQAALRELDGIKRAYRTDPLGNRIGKAVDQVSDSIEGLFRRQAPEVMPQYDAAKQAFKRLSTVEDAVLRAKNTGGVFTPAQLGMSDRASTVKFGGKHKAAAGKGEFHDFQRAMQDVLPNKVPDSGTAGRLALPLGLAAAGGGLGAVAGDPQTGGTTGLTLGALLTLAYSRAGQRGLTKLIKPGSARMIEAGNKVRKAARITGAGTGALAISRD